MKQKAKILILMVLLFFNKTIWAQREYEIARRAIYTALTYGECFRADTLYRWKVSHFGRTDGNLEARIRDCFAQAERRRDTAHGINIQQHTAFDREEIQQNLPQNDPSFHRPIPSFQIIAGVGNGIVQGRSVGGYGKLRFNFRSGSGLGLIGGYGSFDGSRLNHWSVGVIMHRNWFFISGHYGTLSTREVPFSSSSDGSFTLPGEKMLRGMSVLTGFDRHVFDRARWLHLTVGMGGSICFDDSPKFMLAWNIGIGISFNDFFR